MKFNIDIILYKEQFRLKLGLIPLLLSKASIIVLILCILLFDMVKVPVFYGMLMMLYYKFLFNKTRDGYQMDNVLYQALSDFNKSLRNHIKQNRFSNQ
ncbi:hypothetical protein [Helicobacter sp. MIT 14-3879]|uniref:hypothetical protein n=1 Tax=Helicobacter sp. MIT 14-3879 TaxID=2040649 RepID=UPI000E1F747F|nr:hypothetical protein [Helicobacter sp. MIT 14-3879]RDU61839.1 hypothetical protein CQA44_07885 [Helicobacter sp. MIT 14-3879]